MTRRTRRAARDARHIAAVVAPTRGNRPSTPTSEWPALACARSRSATRSSCGPVCWFSVRQILGHWNDATVVPGSRKFASTLCWAIGAGACGRAMNELSGCFGPDRFASKVERAGPPIAVAVAVDAVLPATSRAVVALGLSMAGALPEAGDSSAVSCRYALMNARFVVDMMDLT